MLPAKYLPTWGQGESEAVSTRCDSWRRGGQWVASGPQALSLTLLIKEQPEIKHTKKHRIVTTEELFFQFTYLHVCLYNAGGTR